MCVCLCHIYIYNIISLFYTIYTMLYPPFAKFYQWWVLNTIPHFWDRQDGQILAPPWSPSCLVRLL